MTYADAERLLLALPRFADVGAAAYRPGLDRMHALLAAMGDPHRAFASVHVGGTNGKGSTASLAAAIASASGLRVGLHTSPHLVSLRERMRMDGDPASEAWVADAVGRFEAALRAAEPSFFEATTALSFRAFAEHDVDLAVVEVGLGGRLDATNVLTPVASIVTHVGLDHTDLLGETRAEIAREKAGIAKPGVPLLHAVEGPDARDALVTEARARGAAVEDVRQSCRVDVEEAQPLRVKLGTPVRDYGRVEVGLGGQHQAWNAALAVRAVETALPAAGFEPPDMEAVRAGLCDVVRQSGLRGRGERLAADPRVVLDVAHNADGWGAALDNLAVPPGGTLTVLIGVVADKDVMALGSLLAARGARAWTVGLGGERGRSAEALAATLAASGVEVSVTPGVAEGIKAFRDSTGPNDRLLVTGSHQTVAAALAGRTPPGVTG